MSRESPTTEAKRACQNGRGDRGDARPRRRGVRDRGGVLRRARGVLRVLRRLVAVQLPRVRVQVRARLRRRRTRARTTGRAPAWAKPMSLLVVFFSIAPRCGRSTASRRPRRGRARHVDGGCDEHGDAYMTKCLGYAAGARRAARAPADPTPSPPPPAPARYTGPRAAPRSVRSLHTPLRKTERDAIRPSPPLSSPPPPLLSSSSPLAVWRVSFVDTLFFAVLALLAAIAPQYHHAQWGSSSAASSRS